jgi:hypothetical protein
MNDLRWQIEGLIAAVAVLHVVLFIAVVLEYLGILQLIPIILILLLAASGVY